MRLHFVDEHLSLECERGATTITCANRHLVQRVIRRQLVPALQAGLVAHPFQGRTYEMTLKDRASFQFTSDGRHLSYGAYRWIHKARLLLLPLNSYRHDRNFDKRCRRCSSDSETLLHVLNHCRYNLSHRVTARHNAVQNLFIDTVRRCVKRPYQIAVDKVCDVTGPRLRPDILVRDEQAKRMFIIDVTCPFDSSDVAFYEARCHKIGKYAGIEDYYRARGYSVVNDALIVGSLGAWDPRNDDLLREVGLSFRQARAFKRRAVGACIEHSKDIYWSHMIGDRFKDRSIRAGNPTQNSIGNLSNMDTSAGGEPSTKKNRSESPDEKLKIVSLYNPASVALPDEAEGTRLRPWAAHFALRQLVAARATMLNDVGRSPLALTLRRRSDSLKRSSRIRGFQEKTVKTFVVVD